MKLTQKNFCDSIAFAFLLIAAMQVSAQSWLQTSVPGLPPFKITLTLNATLQGGDEGGYPIDTTTTTTTHLTSQSLLKVVENKLEVSFPKGASLAQSYTNIVVVDATGTNIVENLTTDGLATMTFSDWVIGGSRINQINNAQSMSYNYNFKLSFNDGNGNWLNLTGLAREKYSATPMDPLTGHVTYTETTSSTLLGEGGVGVAGAEFTGSAFISGIGTITVQ